MQNINQGKEDTPRLGDVGTTQSLSVAGESFFPSPAANTGKFVGAMNETQT